MVAFTALASGLVSVVLLLWVLMSLTRAEIADRLPGGRHRGWTPRVLEGGRSDRIETGVPDAVGAPRGADDAIPASNPTDPVSPLPVVMP